MSTIVIGRQPPGATVKNPLHGYSAKRKKEVVNRLRELGADYYDLLLPETRVLPGVLAEDELLEGVVYGRYIVDGSSGASRGLLAITDRRIFLINKKPLFLYYDDMSFHVICGITYGHSSMSEEIMLATRIGNVTLRTFNQACASQFVHAVEQMLVATNKSDSDSTW